MTRRGVDALFAVGGGRVGIVSAAAALAVPAREAAGAWSSDERERVTIWR